jgi:prepilin-type processing-associated H-X9-DG protein
MNSNVGHNLSPYGENPQSKISQWRLPAKKLLLTEGITEIPGLGQPVVGYTSRLSIRHGSAVFHGNVPNFPEMTYGTKHGSNVSTVFMDGHAEGIDQDFAFNPSLFDPKAR